MVLQRALAVLVLSGTLLLPTRVGGGGTDDYRRNAARDLHRHLVVGRLGRCVQRPRTTSVFATTASEPLRTISRQSVDLLERTSTRYLATTIPDGSPQLTQTWADTDGEQVLVNTVQDHQKARNVQREPRVALTLSNPANAYRSIAVRGEVVSSTVEAAAEQVEALAQRYLGSPYPWYGGRDQVRLLLAIRADRIHSMG